MNYKHGKCGSRLYRIWEDMKSRCNNPICNRFQNYGGRGIKVCSEWMDFRTFYDWAITHGYSDDLSIDRIDVNGNYEPSNCRWVTAKEQARNRTSTPKYLYKGIEFFQCNVFELFGVKRTTFQKRIERGWSVEEAVEGRCKL